MRRIAPLALATATLASIVAGGPTPAGAAACDGAATMGCWGAPFAEDALFADRPPQTVEESLRTPTAVSMAVTPTGQIVYWSGLSGLEDAKGPLAMDASRAATPDQSRLLDLNGDGTPLFFVPDNPTGGGKDNLFCADQRLLASGNVIAAGGTQYDSQIKNPSGGAPDLLAELYGSRETRLFDVTGKSGGMWLAGRPESTLMHKRRWYPTLITQADGNLFVAGGVSKLLWNSNGLDPRATDMLPRNVPESETYDPDHDSWTENGDGAKKSLPLFFRGHLLPSEEVLYTAAGQMWGPAGEDVDELSWANKATYDPATQAWRTLDDDGEFGARNGAFSAMLPLKAPYDQAQFLVAGGTLGVSPGLYLGTKITELVTASDSDADGAWETSTERVADLRNDRWFSSGVVLPNGHVLAFSGADKDEVIMPGTERAVRQAELWDGEEWTVLSSAARDRTYHNSALLLPDGTVLVAGHSPINRFYGDKGSRNDELGLFANNFKDPSFEQFFPPYLFNPDGTAAARPVIDTNTVRTTAHYGEKMQFKLIGGPSVAKVVMSRLPSVTHATDADARTVEVAFGHNGQDGIEASVPNDPAVVPPGYYYVFLVSEPGVPSHAVTVKIDYLE